MRVGLLKGPLNLRPCLDLITAKVFLFLEHSDQGSGFKTWSCYFHFSGEIHKRSNQLLSVPARRKEKKSCFSFQARPTQNPAPCHLSHPTEICCQRRLCVPAAKPLLWRKGKGIKCWCGAYPSPQKPGSLLMRLKGVFSSAASGEGEGRFMTSGTGGGASSGAQATTSLHPCPAP